MSEVVLLSQPTCELCDHAKHILQRLAPEYGFTLRELSFDSSEGRVLATSHRLLFAPGVLLDGTPFSYGRLSERRLRRELDRRTDAPS